jgi:hypothetical protein
LAGRDIRVDVEDLRLTGIDVETFCGECSQQSAQMSSAKANGLSTSTTRSQEETFVFPQSMVMIKRSRRKGVAL